MRSYKCPDCGFTKMKSMTATMYGRQKIIKIRCKRCKKVMRKRK